MFEDGRRERVEDVDVDDQDRRSGPSPAEDGDALVARMDALHRQGCRADRDLFELIVQADRAELWRHSGARDLASWLSIRYSISLWKARRWIAAAHAAGAPAGDRRGAF